MSYCLNSNCMDPKNLPEATDCNACGSKLLLRERYRATRVLGKGGFGTTFFATDQGLPGKPDCVIKQLKPLLNTPQYVEQCQKLFQREAETLGKIGSHPQVPRLLDYFELGQEFYLVQEYISGRTLHQEVKHNGPLTEKQTKEVLKEMLPVLGYLHKQQVIHRDIKPPNLIRREIDNKLILIDFGVVNDQAGSNAKNSGAANIVVGTKGFAAPEQQAKHSVYSSDIYGLGMTCVFLLAGRLPKNLDNPSDLSWLNALSISPQFRKILSKILAAEICDRYPSAEDVLQAMEQLGEPTVEFQAPQTAPTPTVPSASVPSPSLQQESQSQNHAAPPLKQSPHNRAASQPKPKQTPPSSTKQPAQSRTSSPAQPAQKSQSQKPPEKQKKKAWWKQSLNLGLASLPPVPEQAISKHQQAMNLMNSFTNKVEKLDHQTFSDEKFIEFAKVQSSLNSSAQGDNGVAQAAELLAAGIQAKDTFQKIQATEARYFSGPVQKIYGEIQALLSRNLEPEAFLRTLHKQARDPLAEIQAERVQQAMQAYLEQIANLTNDTPSFKLFSLFKLSQEGDYSVLQTVSDLLEDYTAGGSNSEHLNRQIRVQYTLFEKLGRVIGIPAQKRLPETYAQLIQYVALSDKYQQYYTQFRQILVLLEKWRKHYKVVVDIRQEFSPDDYKIPKELKQDLPGVKIYEHYSGLTASTLNPTAN